jgi:hypothetical protein
MPRVFSEVNATGITRRHRSTHSALAIGSCLGTHVRFRSVQPPVNRTTSASSRASKGVWCLTLRPHRITFSGHGSRFEVPQSLLM